MDAVLNWLWQGGTVALAAWMMLHALDRAPANVRYVVCWAAALFVIVLPGLPSFPTAGPQAAFDGSAVDAVVSLPSTWWTSTLAILVAWTLWAGIQIVRFASALVAIRRARAASRTFPPDVESLMRHWCRMRRRGRRATLVLSESVTTAAVLAWGSPMIAVSPSLVTMLDADELDRVLIHEWAHVQRRDDLVNIVQVVIRVFVGWHPALWWLDRRAHAEREMACDEMAVAIAGSPKSYAACLVKLASVRPARPGLRTAPAAVSPSGLRGRVLKIVSRRPTIAPIWFRSIAAGIVTALCLTSVTVGGLQLVDAADEPLPLLASRAFGSLILGPPTPTAPSASPDTRIERPAPSAARAPRIETPQQPAEKAPSTSAAPERGDVARTPGAAAAAGIEHQIGEAIALVPPETPSTPPAAAPPSQTPWSAAASGGVAIGRKSRDAGVATGGFFTRFARRVAGSL